MSIHIYKRSKGIKIQDHATNQQSSSKGCGFMKFLLSYPPAKAELWLRVSEHWPFLRWLKLETEVELIAVIKIMHPIRKSACINLHTVYCMHLGKVCSKLVPSEEPSAKTLYSVKDWSKKHKNSIILGVIISNFQHCLSKGTEPM